jgi:hypothetical protein
MSGRRLRRRMLSKLDAGSSPAGGATADTVTRTNPAGSESGARETVNFVRATGSRCMHPIGSRLAPRTRPSLPWNLTSASAFIG